MKNGDLYNVARNKGYDWICSNCDIINFGKRVTCYNCKVDPETWVLVKDDPRFSTRPREDMIKKALMAALKAGEASLETLIQQIVSAYSTHEQYIRTNAEHMAKALVEEGKLRVAQDKSGTKVFKLCYYSRKDMAKLFVSALQAIFDGFRQDDEYCKYVRFPINLSAINQWMIKVDANYTGKIRDMSRYHSFKQLAVDMEKAGKVKLCNVEASSTLALASAIGAPAKMYTPLSATDIQEKEARKSLNAKLFGTERKDAKSRSTSETQWFSGEWNLRGSAPNFEAFWGSSLVNYGESTQPKKTETTHSSLELLEALAHCQMEHYATQFVQYGLTSMRKCTELFKEGKLRHTLILFVPSLRSRDIFLSMIETTVSKRPKPNQIHAEASP